MSALCYTAASSAQRLFLGLPLPCLQQGQASWGRTGGLNPGRVTLDPWVFKFSNVG